MDSARNGPAKKSGHPWRWVGGGLICGVILTCVSVWAISYTDQRQFCASCHIMREAAVTQKLGMHRNLTCNECHAPHNLMAKLPFKAVSGAEDIWGNIVGKDVPIPPSKKQMDVINKNCIACHGPVNETVAVMAAKPYCVDCHRSVGHNRMTSISQRTVGYD